MWTIRGSIRVKTMWGKSGEHKSQVYDLNILRSFSIGVHLHLQQFLMLVLTLDFSLKVKEDQISGTELFHF